MYDITHHQNTNILEVNNSKNQVHAKICLNDGASLQELKLNSHEIIQDLSPLTYDNTYASSILFPFANRIKDGIYSFNNTLYQFDINQKEENNALHGLVYNKTFHVVETKVDDNSATIKLEYVEKSKPKGFPYTYSIILEYEFTKTHVCLKIDVKNTDGEAFPFTLGWHPYFVSDNLFKSALKFESTQKLMIGERNITTGIKEIKPSELFQVKNKQLDDCWILNSGVIQFLTPKYKLILESSEKNNFLQLYTPPKLNTIAIEPTTGVSDSFNNNIGLQILKPKETYSITWNLRINN
ncbi:aldose 1-epimerase [Litoribaculum gwangyangense]|uniref:Aldose 1-epimerase n=1 Tax=Litoribaculum gwangyangense TaxID=1130722 RepID=A0ABP9CH26_9FLAO